ncbi:tetratricopeptide repeat protein [Croceicoccus marinus]|uniref:Uncharacterized protein n=1 Tax=Croceicoccus marinus TaxID=450378 RepID=A0A1Z1FB22_9SPHN|nr:tetratricopeptide repeat protein [Croceicoccus marinus]ARU15933.1 hypothetical protein A9D14_06720 [Croceicoccus marinus]
MQFIASGQAGTFAVRTATGFLVERVDIGAAHEASARDISYYFSNCNDLTVGQVRSIAEARDTAKISWSVDRAVRLFVILIDPCEPPSELVEVGEALEELLEVRGVVERVEAQLFAAPLPEPFDVEACRKAIAKSSAALALLDRFLNLQPMIAEVRDAFEAIDENAFDAPRHRNYVRELAIDRGGFRDLVIALHHGESIDKALFGLFAKLRGVDNGRAIVQLWTESFKRVRHQLVAVAEPDQQTESWRDTSALGGRQAFERAIQQQNAVVKQIKAGDFETARRYARDLVADQRKTSRDEHIAKSLTNLSQKAKELEVLELALEWVREALEFKGDDGQAHGQLGDLLMRIGHFSEAHRSLDLAESFGEASFAASGRARMLRYQGQFEEALHAYRVALEHFEAEPERKQFNLAGIAECLRDLERFDEALAAYDIGIAQCPYAAALHSGRAATLVEMGRFEEAYEGYKAASNLDDSNVVPRNGLATLYRRVGDFKRAEQIYRNLLEDYPFDPHTRGGLIATLRDLGRFEEAVEEAKAFVHQLPGSPDAVWSLLDALIDARRFDEAEAALKTANDDFRYVAGLRIGMARIEKAKGRYASALALYDDAARDFPSHPHIQLGRADMLRRLGQVDEALSIYQSAFDRHPQRLILKNAIASIYIHQFRYAEALPLLVIDDPRTADEWRNFALRGMLDSAANYLDDARERFEWAIEHCPFRREQNMLRAALSRVLLMIGRTEAAVKASQPCDDPVAELLKFHATAVLSDKGPARALYEHLQRSLLPEPYHELRDEIASQFNVVDLVSYRNHTWLLKREQDILLLEAA